MGAASPEKLLPPTDQTDRDLPRTNGVGVVLAYGAYATVYQSECSQGPKCPLQGIRAGEGAGCSTKI